MLVESRNETPFGDLDLQIHLGYMDKKSGIYTGDPDDLTDLEHLREVKFYASYVFGEQAASYLVKQAIRPIHRNPLYPVEVAQQLDNFRFYRGLQRLIYPQRKAA